MMEIYGMMVRNPVIAPRRNQEGTSVKAQPIACITPVIRRIFVSSAQTVRRSIVSCLPEGPEEGGCSCIF